MGSLNKGGHNPHSLQDGWYFKIITDKIKMYFGKHANSSVLHVFCWLINLFYINS